ncbi:hypothetical protein evm_014346 [Chilo suppressalis]|nr:hypothetical protein evm_014346 [Chilo suppressalis]
MNPNYPNNPYNGNKNFIRNQFNQNRNVENHYQNGNHFNKNPNYYQNNKFNRNPNQNPHYNPNANYNRNPYRQNGNFNQNTNANFNRNPNNFNNRGPYQNGNFYRNQNGNFNPTNNKFSSIHNEARQGNNIYGHASPPPTFEQYHSPINNIPINPSNNKFNDILNQAYHATPASTPEPDNPLDNEAKQVEVTTEPVNTVVTTNETGAVITDLTTNGTETVVTAPTTISETADPHIDPEAYLPALYGDMGLLESGKAAETTINTEPTTFERTATPSTVLTTAAPLTVLVTMQGGSGPALATTPPHFEIPPVTLSPFIQDQTDLMKELKSGYFTAAMVGLFDSLATKDPKHARVLFRSVNNEFENLVKYDKIYELGRPLFDALDKLSQLVSSAPVDALQAYCKILHHAMFTRRQTVTTDINSVIDYIDKIFNEDDGVALFKAVEKIHNYPNVTIGVEKLLRDFTDALFHPLIRYHGHAQERVLLDSLNKLIDNHIHAAHAKRRFKSNKLTVAWNNNMHLKNYNAAKTLTHNVKTFDAINKKLRKSKVQSTTIMKLIRDKQQRYKKVRGTFDSAQKLNEKTEMRNNKEIPTWTITKTTELKQLNRNTTKKITINNKKSHHNKLSLKKHIKLKHPKLYKKYYKKDRKRSKTKRHKKQKKSHKQYIKNKLTKTDKLLLKIKIMEHKYQKLLKHFTAIDHLRGHMNSTRVDSTATSRTVVTKSPINFLTRPIPAKNKIIFGRQQKWLPVKSKPRNEDTFSVPVNLMNKNKVANDDSKIMSKKFHNFNNPLKKKKERFVNSMNVEETSYSDDEDVLKFKINDAIKLERHHFNARRQGSDTTTHIINKLLSSSSSEEILLKSKIYKELLFNNTSESNSDAVIDIDDKQKFKDSFKRVLARRNNVRSISVYSDDEDLFKKNLNI